MPREKKNWTRRPFRGATSLVESIECLRVLTQVRLNGALVSRVTPAVDFFGYQGIAANRYD